MTDLKQKILEAIKPNQLGVLSTISEDNKPLGRYMMVTGDDDLNLFCVTSLSSRKVGNMRHNPHVHVTMGISTGMQPPWIHFSGTAEILSDQETRNAHWDDMLKQYFSGPDDPEYCVIKMSPERIEYWAGMEPLVWSR